MYNSLVNSDDLESSVQSMGGAKYFVIFISDFFKKICVYLNEKPSIFN